MVMIDDAGTFCWHEIYYNRPDITPASMLTAVQKKMISPYAILRLAIVSGMD